VKEPGESSLNVAADLGDRVVELGLPPASYQHLSGQAIGGLQVDYPM
jgi:hypothetical protein